VTFYEDDMTIEVEFDDRPQISVGNVKIHLQETEEGVLITAEDAEGKEQALVRNGTPGEPGEDGFSPIVAVSNISGGKRVSITDKNGTKTFDLLNGAPGEPGTPGYTPVKGKDYWTAADKAEMVSAVLAALPVYNGEVETI
jgi:hypothetical protein